jgi:hypothetical protein
MLSFKLKTTFLFACKLNSLAANLSVQLKKKKKNNQRTDDNGCDDHDHDDNNK